MFSSFINLLPFSVMISMLTMSIQRKHLLMSLLSLEAMMLSLTTFITLLSSYHSQVNMVFCLILLSFAACEAALGLALLVSMIRSYGSDLIKLLSINKC